MRLRENLSSFRVSRSPAMLVTVMESLNLIVRCVRLFIPKKTSYSYKQNVAEECNVFYYLGEISKA